jgi:hypothetical protein
VTSADLVVTLSIAPAAVRPGERPLRGVNGMIEATRHVALESRIWDPVEAQTAIDEIVDDAYAQLDVTRFWLAHP